MEEYKKRWKLRKRRFNNHVIFAARFYKIKREFTEEFNLDLTKQINEFLAMK